MNRNDFYIFKNQSGKIYAYTDDLKQVYEYIDKAIKQGFEYTYEKNGIAIIYTISKR